MEFYVAHRALFTATGGGVVDGGRYADRMVIVPQDRRNLCRVAPRKKAKARRKVEGKNRRRKETRRDVKVNDFQFSRSTDLHAYHLRL